MKSAAGNAPVQENRILARRRALRLPQGELAARCGISRQFLNRLEGGRAQPNVQLALRLAAGLGASVEDLFAAADAAQRAAGLPVALADATLADGARLDLARIGGRWVAHAADSVWSLGAGYAEADAILARADAGARARTQRAADELEHNLVIAGCDPALGLLRGRGPTALPGRCIWLNCGSGRALDLLAGGWVHVAGLHYGGTDGAANLAQVAKRDPRGEWTVIRFTRWENGWMLRPGRRGKFAGVEALASGRLRLANREPGAGSRSWLDGRLEAAQVPVAAVTGYGRELPNHWEVARALADNRADVAVGPRAVATAFGLEFVPVEEVAFDLVVPRLLLDHPRVEWLLHRLRSREFQHELEMLPGYAAGEAGGVLARRARR